MLLTFIIKDSPVGKDIYTLLLNHKLAFCDYVTTGINFFFLFELTFSSIDFATSWRELAEMRYLRFFLLSFPKIYEDRAFSCSLLCVIITCNHLCFFKIFSNFVIFYSNFQIFCPFFSFFWKIVCIPLLSIIGPGR